MKATALVFAATLFVAGCKSESSTTADSAPPASPPPSSPPAAASTPAGAPLTGYAAVQDVFTKNCVGCHGAGRPKAGIQLTDYAAAMKGGREGAVVVAGDPDGSLLIKAVRRAPGAKAMPPRAALPPDQVKILEKWVKDGAKA
jgi:mono/diheme cytochrome c family protein